MTSEEGLNLAGVETVLELEQRLERMRAEMARMRKRAAADGGDDDPGARAAA